MSEGDRGRRSDPARFCQRLLQKRGSLRVFAEMMSGEYILSQRALNIGPLWKEVLPVTLISLLAGAVKRAARADCSHSHVKTCQRRQIWTLTTSNSPAGCFVDQLFKLPALGERAVDWQNRYESQSVLGSVQGNFQPFRMPPNTEYGCLDNSAKVPDAPLTTRCCAVKKLARATGLEGDVEVVAPADGEGRKISRIS